MKLSILMPALEQRDFQPLLEDLQAQALAFPEEVEILHLTDDGSLTSGRKRQTLTELASGEYIAFVDDDDKVSRHYINQMLKACYAGADVVTFNLEFYFNGCRQETWQFGPWKNNRIRQRMTMNHLCAWRKSLAQRVAWDPHLGYGDDQLWYQPLLASGLVVNTQHINRTLYQYLFDPAATVNQDSEHVRRARCYVGSRGLRCFWREDREIVIEVGPPQTGPTVRARDRDNQVETYPISELKMFHVARLE